MNDLPSFGNSSRMGRSVRFADPKESYSPQNIIEGTSMEQLNVIGTPDADAYDNRPTFTSSDNANKYYQDGTNRY